MPIVVTEINIKGGTTKTTTNINLAHALAKRGKRVILLDGDFDRSATAALGFKPAPKEKVVTVYDILTQAKQGIKGGVVTYSGTAAYHIAYPGCFDFIRGSRNINRAPDQFDRTKLQQPPEIQSFEHVLPYLLERDLAGYEYVLIDPRLSGDRMSEAILAVSNVVIAPMSPEPLAIDGIANLLELLQEVNDRRTELNVPGRIEFAGILIAKVMSDQTAVAGHIQQIATSSGIPVFPFTLPYTSEAWQASGERLPIEAYVEYVRQQRDPHLANDPVAAGYNQLADLIITRYH